MAGRRRRARLRSKDAEADPDPDDVTVDELCRGIELGLAHSRRLRARDDWADLALRQARSLWSWLDDNAVERTRAWPVEVAAVADELLAAKDDDD